MFLRWRRISKTLVGDEKRHDWHFEEGQELVGRCRVINGLEKVHVEELLQQTGDCHHLRKITVSETNTFNNSNTWDLPPFTDFFFLPRFQNLSANEPARLNPFIGPFNDLLELLTELESDLRLSWSCDPGDDGLEVTNDESSEE